MEWRDEGLIIGVRRHGEASTIVEALTRAHGRHLGLVRGGRSARLRATLDLIKSNGRALRRYHPEPYAGRLTIFSAEARSAPDLLAAWSTLAPAGVELHRVAGDHYTMLRPPHVAALADRLRECLVRR